MATATYPHGWMRLSNGYDVEFRHGIPYRVSDNGREAAMPLPALLDEIAALGDLRVQLGEWRTGEHPQEREARLFVARDDLTEVLRRLAHSSAVVFVDRYHKPIDSGDVDWDRLEYLKDFREALDCCGLDSEQVDPATYQSTYADVMHLETRRLAGLPESPPVEAELR